MLRFDFPSYLLAGLLLIWLLPAVPARAQSQTQHCLAANGTRIYTDRNCSDLGADTWQPPVAGDDTNRPRSLCPRSVSALAFRLESALDAGDANRLAGLYDWAGMGGAAANAVLTRLQAVAARKLVGVQPLEDADGQPSGMLVEQVQADGVQPAQVSFGLRRRMGCWWLHL